MLNLNIDLNWMFVIDFDQITLSTFNCQSFDVNTLTKFEELEHSPEPPLLNLHDLILHDGNQCENLLEFLFAKVNRRLT